MTNNSDNVLRTINSNGAAFVSNTVQPQLNFEEINWCIGYRYDWDFQNNYIKGQEEKGKSCIDIVEEFARYSLMCVEYENKRNYADHSYIYLLSRGYSKEQAADILANIYDRQNKNRGIQRYYIDSDGISYNYSVKFTGYNQAYDIPSVMEEIRQLPEDVRKCIKNVNFYDTFNPWDYYWDARYRNNCDCFFRSAGSGGNGEINIWSTSQRSRGLILHEAAHCFDEGNKYSHSSEYLEVVLNDRKVTPFCNYITTYGSNDLQEDFADTMVAYITGYVWDNTSGYVPILPFPNRREYFNKIIKVNGCRYLSRYNEDLLFNIFYKLMEELGIETTLMYIDSCITNRQLDLSLLTFKNTLNERVVSANAQLATINIDEVVEFYFLYRERYKDSIKRGGFKL